MSIRSAIFFTALAGASILAATITSSHATPNNGPVNHSGDSSKVFRQLPMADSASFKPGTGKSWTVVGFKSGAEVYRVHNSETDSLTVFLTQTGKYLEPDRTK